MDFRFLADEGEGIAGVAMGGSAWMAEEEFMFEISGVSFATM